MRATFFQLERPRSVIFFELVSLLYAATRVVSPDGSVLENTLESAIWVGVTLWVTRGRSRIARVLCTGLLLLGTLGIAVFYTQGLIAPDDVRLVAIRAVCVLALLLTPLWWSSTTAWLKGATKS